MNTAASPLHYSTPERLALDFACRGLVVLAPESLGIPAEVHQQIYTQEKAAYLAKRPITPASVPQVLQVLNAPGLVAACNQLLGGNWAIVPFTHNASFTSGARDQHWHKDDNGPYNARKQRHHQAVQLEMLYYPQAVAADMGPTATIPYSQYWALNHEENQDNFAGADHLDFNYMLSGMEGQPISGPDSKYDPEEIRQGRTAHDLRMRQAVADTGWPLVRSLEAGPLRAGSIVIYSHNTYHRGNHRRDDWHTWEENPRFMWRFWLYRTTEPGGSPPAEPDWERLGVDPLTQVDLSGAGEDLTSVWRYHHHWLATGKAPAPRTAPAEAERLFAQLQTRGEAAEPARIGAAYRLAALEDKTLAAQLLGRALYDERESVRRAATYGLVAVGPEATGVLLAATTAPLKWVRKAGVYGLGDVSPLSEAVLRAVGGRLQDDPSVYVRAVAAGTLGCLGRRAVATGEGRELVPGAVAALVQSLAREENRPCMSRAQGRSIKFVRPTDDCDVCEGAGVDFGLERFKPVRSAVRENALWSLVILCSHGAAVLGPALAELIPALTKVVRTDQNPIALGLAMDALNRLAHLGLAGDALPPLVAQLQGVLPAVLGEAPLRPWESLVRGGLDAAALSRIEGR